MAESPVSSHVPRPIPDTSSKDSSASPSTNPTVICVFCGASPGTSPAHIAAARALAQVFHTHNIHLVYGAGTTGLMGEVARTLVSLSGPQAVHGIIPDALVQFEQQGRPGWGGADEKDTDTVAAAAEQSKPLAKCTIDEAIFGRTTIVQDMHTRKQLMAKAVIEGGPGSGFIALSGGYGTMEELLEMITWNQLGIHGKGICIYNVEGYYDGLIAWVKSAVTAGFVAPGNAGILVEARDAEQAVACLKDYQVAEGRLKLNWDQK